MGDLTILLLASACALVLAGILARWLARIRPKWRRRGVMLPAFPIAGPFLVLGAFVTANAQFGMMFKPETCGVDACGMANMAGIVVFGWSALVFVCALIIAAIVRNRTLQ